MADVSGLGTAKVTVSVLPTASTKLPEEGRVHARYEQSQTTSSIMMSNYVYYVTVLPYSLNVVFT